MSVVDKAPPAATLELMDVNPQTFKMRDGGDNPCVVSIPGSSSFDLALFDVIAIGTVNPTVPGSLTIALLGRAKDSDELLPLASVSESIGGEGELDETMWMVRGKDMMIFTGSGRMQGTFDSNVANHPQPPLDLDHRPGNITESDPLYVFGIAVTFTPVAMRSGKAEERAAAAPCSVKLASLTVNG